MIVLTESKQEDNPPVRQKLVGGDYLVEPPKMRDW